MAKKSRIVMVAGSGSRGSGAHEHPAGCGLSRRAVKQKCERRSSSGLSGVARRSSNFHRYGCPLLCIQAVVKNI